MNHRAVFQILCFGAICIFSGCVRVAGTAGYARATSDGDVTAKQVGFDTQKLLPKNEGNITV